MRTFGSSHATIVSMSCLIGPILGCNPDTYGLGDVDAEIGQADGFEADIGDDSMGADAGDENDNGDGDGDNGGSDGGDGEGAASCLDPLGPPLRIELDGLSEDCDDVEFSAMVTKSDAGAYSLTTCDCNDLACAGDELLLTVDLPKLEWLPKLELDGCYQFHVFAEQAGAELCRRNRLDIFTKDHEVIWYSTGSAREDLQHNGFDLNPVFHSTCVDQCGEWDLRDVTFTVKEGGMTLAQGHSDAIGFYEVMNWHSYRAPLGCKSPVTETTAWTARYIE